MLRILFEVVEQPPNGLLVILVLLTLDNDLMGGVK